MTITLTRKEAEQVLDALEWNLPVIEDFGDKEQLHIQHRAIETLRARLAQPEPEPFGIWHQGDTYEESDFYLYKDSGDVACKTCVKLYTAPPQRKEPDPVADKYLMEIECTKCGAKQDGILTVNTPPQREWQGLTDEDFSTINQSCSTKIQAAASTESILKERNS
jgi:hypothetical protein